MDRGFLEGIPYYYQIKGDLRRRILGSEFGSGGQIPGEVELARTYRVSRPTVRQAIQGLVADGLVERRRGKGTFVRAATFMDNAEMFSLFTDQVAIGGATGWSEVVEVRPAAASPPVVGALGLEPSAEVFEVAIRYHRASQPVAVRTLSVAVAAMPDLPAQLAAKSLAGVMGDLDLAGGGALQTFSAIKCPKAQADLLGLEAGDPVMVWSGVLYTAEAVARAHVLTMFRGDRITFMIRQGRPVVAAVADAPDDGGAAPPPAS